MLGTVKYRDSIEYRDTFSRYVSSHKISGIAQYWALLYMYLQEICNSVSADEHRPRLNSLSWPWRSTWSAARQHWQIRSARFFFRVRAVPMEQTIYHRTFRKCLINQNNLLEHWKLYYFQKSLTISTYEDNIKRRVTAKTSTLTFILTHTLARPGKGAQTILYGGQRMAS